MFCPSRRRRRVVAATTPVFHHLEKRLLLHGAVNVAIDFQPVGSAPAEGFFADVGRPYGERTHGMSYGWRRDSGAWTNSWAYERDHPASLSQAGDTLISAGWAGDLRWEIALPAGRYRVTLLAGDALAAAGERFVAEIEGRQALDFTASPTEKLVTATLEVDVLDGRLTLAAPDGLSDTRFASIQIEGTHDENGTTSGGSTGGGDGHDDDGGGIVALTDGGTLIDFEELPHGAAGLVYEHASGHRFRSLPGGGGTTAETLWIRGSQEQYASKVLHPANYSRKIVLDRTDGASFDLASFSYAAGRWNEAGDAIVTGYFTDGTTQTLTVGFTNRSLKPLSVDWASLSRVEINYAGGVNAAYGALDNFLVGTTGGDGGDDGDGGGAGGPTDAVVNYEPAALGPIASGVYSESGFTFTNLPGRGGTGTQAFQIYGAGQGYSSKVIQPANWGRRIDITRADGTSFDLSSLDYAAGRWSEAGDFVLTGTFAAGGTQSMTVSFATRQLKTLAVNWTGLKGLSVNFAGGANDAYGAIDNLKFVVHGGDGDGGGAGDGGGDGGDDGGGVTLGSWTIHGSMPVQMMEGAVAALNGMIYLWGGFDNGWTWVSKSHGYRFDPGAGKWQRVADLPLPLTHASAVPHEGRIYFFGGYANNGSFVGNTDNVYVYDPVTDRFSTWGTMPYAVSGYGGVKVGSRMHIIGGMFRDATNRFVSNSTHHFSIDLDDPVGGWRIEPSVPVGRDHAAALGVDGGIYFFGGQERDDQYNGVRDEMWRYDLARRVWEPRARMPGGGLAHVGQSSVLYGGRILVAGGNFNGAVNQNVSDQVLMYDPQTDAWSVAGRLPEGRRGVHSAIIGQTLWLFGGATSYPRNNVWSSPLSLT